mmetsp:Transcript_5002/g.18055  ORF Transcript_5002/g.18055 Transcript_5002/m.18055 type:complete len:86 (-) Transcript_5002:1342-1599(-)
MRHVAKSRRSGSYSCTKCLGRTLIFVFLMCERTKKQKTCRYHHGSDQYALDEVSWKEMLCRYCPISTRKFFVFVLAVQDLSRQHK